MINPKCRNVYIPEKKYDKILKFINYYIPRQAKYYSRYYDLMNTYSMLYEGVNHSGGCSSVTFPFKSSLKKLYLITKIYYYKFRLKVLNRKRNFK